MIFAILRYCFGVVVGVVVVVNMMLLLFDESSFLVAVVWIHVFVMICPLFAWF